jgi:HlyD family secretion protein
MTRVSRFALVTGAALAAIAVEPFAAPAANPDPQTPPAAAQAVPRPAIRVVAAERRELVETLPVNGTVLARDEAVAGTDLNGMIVLDLGADQGDRITKGQVLARLDRSMLDTQLAQMEATKAQGEASVAQMDAQIGDARVAVKQADEALDRVSTLQSRGFGTKADLDTARNSAESARARFTSAQKALAVTTAQLESVAAQMSGVQVQIDKTSVKAPADGIVLSRAATVGGIVSPSSGALFRIAVDGAFELEANVAESALPRLSPGLTALVRLPGVDTPVEGKIRRISPEVDQKTRLGRIRIALSAGSPARAGSFGKADIEIARRVGIAVPTSALLYADGKPLLQVVENGKVRTTEVTLGLRDAAYVEVTAGLTEGQEVVARAGTFVADGDMVEPVRGDVTGAIRP